MPFLLAEILNFQGSTHRIGVGSFSHLIYRLENIWAVAHLFDSIDVLGVDDITCKVVGILKDISFGD